MKQKAKLAALRKLYQRRLVLRTELAQINAQVMLLEGSNGWDAPLCVHHEREGCRMGRKSKQTSDWSLVDCLQCWKRRRTPPRPAPYW